MIDGGDVHSVKFTAAKLNTVIKDKTCVCHQMNNMVKRMVEDYLEQDYLKDWRSFVSRIRRSKPFEDIWDENCMQKYGKKIILQLDTPTRWSSTVLMIQKAFSCKLAVERMYNTIESDEHKVCNFPS